MTATEEHLSLRRLLLFVSIAASLLYGCMQELRRVDLSHSDSKDQSYLLVDKSDYSADGAVLVERIDERKVDLLLDPAVYVLDSGSHTISFSFHGTNAPRFPGQSS